jgi:tRNA pseudouridine38-40 synthase
MAVAYDGTAYAGFQAQPGRDTIQARLEQALGCRVRAAGRTDAGVHALGQVVDFWYDGPVPTERLVRALALPPDIVPVAAWEVPPDFHARHHAVAKQYRYLIWRGERPSPFVARYSWHYPGPLDLEAMQAFAATLVGRHDFAAYAVAGRPVRDSVRTLTRCTVSADGPLLVVRVAADGFLYKMVRRIVGRLWEVGRGAPELRSVAPPQGLCLEWVAYATGLAPALPSTLK